MKKFLFIAIVFSSCSVQSVYVKKGYPQFVPAVAQDSIVHTIFFIGDAGEALPDGKEVTLRTLTSLASHNPKNTSIIFLGDNIYPSGLPDLAADERGEMERRLNEQLAVAEHSKAQTIFIPGNHDWQKQGSDGLATLKRQEYFLRSKKLPNLLFLPSEGFPGPAIVDIKEGIRIVIIDTQWWLHEYEKPFYPHANSENETKKAFLDSLTRALNTERKVIVAAHHPLETHGQHGGFFDWEDHIFPLHHVYDWMWIPLPGLGSLYPLLRMLGISNQDLSHPRYAEMKTALDSIFSLYNIAVYAAGHEHTLQILKSKLRHVYLVSGYGIASHSESLTVEENTVFARLAPGFMRLDYLSNGLFRLSVIEAVEGEENGVEIFSMKLR